MSAKNKHTALVWAEIDLDALRHNLKIIRRKLGGKHAQILAIVKADAYGHGMAEIAKALSREGVNFFGVANVDEAVALRRVLARALILVLGSFDKSQADFFFQHRITPTVSSLEDFRLLERLAEKKRKRLQVHVKIDTGMGRLGFSGRALESFFHAVSGKSAVQIEGLYTHFSRADHEDREPTRLQLERFHGSLAKIRRLGFQPKYLHSANSVGLCRFKNSHGNLVRPGIILYGLNPACGLEGIPRSLKPILSLKTRIAFLKEVPRGTSLSYGATYRTRGETKIAVIPVGYSHGYRVGFSNRSEVLVRGRRCPVVGRVTMDQTLVDVGAVPGVRRWDKVTLIGKDGREEISAVDLAKLLDTIPYEILCAIHPRIPRFYH